MTHKEVMQQALEALEICEQDGYIPVRLTRDSITALRKALEQPEQMTLPTGIRVSQLNRGCGVCGIGANGQTMGYVCTRSDCPTRVTCGGVA
jgi:hypothetical protein